MRSNFSAYLLIILGLIFLLSKFDWMPGLTPLLFDWWPLILIAVGVSRLLRHSRHDQA